MLQTMRSSAKFVMWILLVSFVGGFLLVETSGLLGSSPVTPATAVATVNGKDILYLDWQQRAEQLVQQNQQQTGRSLTQDEIERLQNQAFDEMVAEVLLQQQYRKRGISVTDAELLDYARYAPPQWVRSDPSMQTDGQFDPAKYQRYLGSAQARQGGLLVALERYYRSEVPKEKLFQRVTSGIYSSDAELWRAWRDAADSASISFVAFHPPASPSDTTVSDADLRRYFDAHLKEFDRPARAVLQVLHIPRVVTAADSAAVRRRIGELRAEIIGGAKFEDVAKRESADTASAVQGGDLGKVWKGRMVPDFEKAGFALRPGELSQPVLTQFGYHLIKMDSRQGDTISLRHILLNVQPSDSTMARVDREADRLAKLAATHENPKALDSAAKTLGITPFRVTAVEGEPATYEGRVVPSASAWAFRDAKVGDISDLFDAPDGYYIARLDSMAQGGKSFDAVKGDVRARIAMQRALDRAMPVATALAKAAQGSSLEAAATQTQANIEKTGLTTRGGAAQAFGSVGEAIGAAFVMPLNTVSDPIRQEDGIYVIRVDERKPADKLSFEKELKALRGRQLEPLRRQKLQTFLEDLRATATIDDRRKEINAQIRRQNASS